MAQSNSDELADALARMAGGDISPSENEPPAPPAPVPARTIRPASTRPAAPAAAPASPVPVAPSPPPAPPRVRPAAPAIQPTASAPVIRPAMPVTRKARPAAPAIAPAPAAPAAIDPGAVQPMTQQSPASEIIDDDDLMAMPAPDVLAYEPKKKNVLADARAKIAAKRSLEFRRTLIPILLTSGVMMLGFASLKLVADPDSSLVAVPIWVPALLVCGALVFLALAVVNMLSVKQQMATAAQSK